MRYLPFKRKVLLGERSMTVYSLGWLAILASFHPMTLRKWEGKGILPKPIFEKQIDPVFRFYTAGELIGYAGIIKRYPRQAGKAYDPQLKVALYNFYTALKKQLEHDGASVVEALPNEAKIEAMLKNNPDRNDRRIAGILLTRIKSK